MPRRHSLSSGITRGIASRAATYLIAGMSLGPLVAGPAAAQVATPIAPDRGATTAFIETPAPPPAVQRGAAPPCPGDCDGSGTVDFNDLVTMLFQFGTPGGGSGCDADESGIVDFNDLVTALFLFGQCPDGEVLIPLELVLTHYDAYEHLTAAIDLNQGNPLGGRAVLELLRDEFIPTAIDIVQFELDAIGANALQPFPDRCELEVTNQINQMLIELPDPELNQIVYETSELHLFPIVFQLQGQQLFNRINAEAVGGFLPASSFSAGWIWDWTISILECVSKGIGAIIVKIIGAIHSLIHSDSGLLGATGDGAMALAMLSTLSTAIVDGQAQPDGGRQVVILTRDLILPFIGTTLTNELTDPEDMIWLPLVQVAMVEGTNAANEVLLQPDPLINQALYSDPSLVPFAETLLLAQPDIQLLIDQRAGGLSKWLWDTLVSIIECIPDVGKLIAKLLSGGHSAAHSFGGNPTLIGGPPTGDDIVDDFALTFNALAGDPTRGRQMVLYVRDVTLEAMEALMSAELIAQGEQSLATLVALGIVVQQMRMTALLSSTDEELNAGLYDNRPDVQVFCDAWETHMITPIEGTGGGGAFAWNIVLKIVKCMSSKKGNSSDINGDEEEEEDKITWVIGKLHGILH